MSEPRDTGWARLSSVRIGAVVALAIAAAFVVWLIVRGNDDSSGSTTTTAAKPPAVRPIGPVASTPAALRALSASSKQPIYWLGPRRGRTYELTRTGNGSVYVRYLPPGTKIGNRKSAYTIVGSYPTPNAVKVLQDLAKRPNEKSASAPGGGIAVWNSSLPTNVYVAFPGSDTEVEVFDPVPRKALRLVTTGRVAPVG